MHSVEWTSEMLFLSRIAGEIMKVKEIMCRSVMWVRPNTPVAKTNNEATS
jgi:hypothetical protein